MNLFSRLFRVARSYANSIGEWPEPQLCTDHTSENLCECIQAVAICCGGHDWRGSKPDGGQHINALQNKEETLVFAACPSGSSESVGEFVCEPVCESHVCLIAVSSVEDPEKMLEQTVNEMQTDLIKMRQASAQVGLVPACCSYGAQDE